MPKSRVIIADDHVMFREGLARLLADEVEVVAAVANGRELLVAVRTHRPDIVIADLTMPELSGLDALRKLREEGNAVRFVILTGYADAAIAAEAIRVGAIGYVVKHAAGEELVEALRLAAANRTFLSPLVSEEVVQRLARGAASPGATLTPRQREILRLLAEGKRVKEIAGELGLSTRTVETHKYEIMRALDIDSTVDLVKFAIRQGIIAP